MIVAKKEYDYFHSEKVNIKNKNRKKLSKKKKRIRALQKLIIIGMAVSGLVLALFILYRYVNITEIRLSITDLEKQRIELEKEKENLVAELETIKSSSKVEEDAMIKLGMDYPAEEQIVYLEVEESVFTDKHNQINKFFIAKYFKNIFNLVLSLF